MKGTVKGVSVVALALLASFSYAGNTVDDSPRIVSFEEVAPYATAGVLAQRMFHGLLYAQLEEQAREGEVDLRAYTVDPRSEEWLVHVPASEDDSSQGRGVLVWFFDENVDTVPDAFRRAAEMTDTILVVPIDGGAEADPVLRRAAMALHAINWTVRNHAVDARRVYVGGSGHSAGVAQRLAASYPDVFAGAIVVGGGEALGSSQLPIPSPMLLQLLRERSATLAIVEADDDVFTTVQPSYARVCVKGVRRAGNGDGTVHANDLVDAVGVLASSGALPLDANCVQALNHGMASAVEEIEVLIERNRGKQAASAILDLHLKYGGIAATPVMNLKTSLEEKFTDLVLDSREMLEASARGKPERVEPLRRQRN